LRRPDIGERRQDGGREPYGDFFQRALIALLARRFGLYQERR
jgi:hypothetical protein